MGRLRRMSVSGRESGFAVGHDQKRSLPSKHTDTNRAPFGSRGLRTARIGMLFKKGNIDMKHFKSVTKDAPATANILTWGGSLKAAWGAYINLLAGQPDGRTADPADGDIGNPDSM